MKTDKRMSRIIKTFFQILFLLILLGLTYAYAMFQGGFVSWFLFFSFSPIALYSIFLLLYPFAYKIERTIHSDTFHAGENVPVKLTITGKFPIPLFYLVVQDLSSEALSKKENKQIVFPLLKRQAELTYVLKQVPRGEHTFEKVYLKTGDLFGFVTKEKVIPLKQKILVHPEIIDLKLDSFTGRSDQGDMRALGDYRNNPIHFAGVREYQPGDRFSRIDWKASARTNELMSKEFEFRRSNKSIVIFDTAPSKSFELSVTFAASAIRALLKLGDETGLAAGNESFVPISGGELHYKKILRKLSIIKPSEGYSIANLFNQEPIFFGDPAVFIIITTALSKQLIDKTARLVRDGHVILFAVKEAGEELTPDEKALKIEGGQKGLSVHTLYENDFPAAFAEVKRA